MLDLNNRPASMLLMGHGDTRRGPKVEKAASAYAHVYRLNDGRRKSYLFTPMKCDGCKISLTLEL